MHVFVRVCVRMLRESARSEVLVRHHSCVELNEHNVNDKDAIALHQTVSACYHCI